MLSEWEQELRRVIKKSDAPFLGLLGDALSSQVRSGISDAIALDPTIEGYIRRLYRYPALFAVHLTSAVMSGMGQSGNYDLYRHICAAAQLKTEPNVDDREALWGAFRRAVLQIGLEVSPKTSGHHFMADTYLRQAGVPIAFADDLAERMLVFAKTAGLPDADDPDGITRWQSALDGKLVAPFSRVAQRAVAFDTQGFYTRTFIKVYESEGALAGANRLEQAMARAFEVLGGGGRLRRAALPYLVLNFGELGVFVPAGDSGRTIEMNVDGKSQTFNVGVADEFFHIAAPLPLSVTVRDSSSQQTIQYEVWGDEKPNRILLFTEQGRFKGRAQLGMAESLLLPPGKYTALCRFEPTGVVAEEVSEEPRLFSFPVFLHPGEQRILANGSAVLTLQGESRLLALWSGASKGTKDSIEFNYGPLGVDFEFPLDWLGISAEFELSLSSAASTMQASFPIRADAQGHATFSISNTPWCESLQPGLSRILAEVRRCGEARALFRSSVLYWRGLESVSVSLKFQMSRAPLNLLEKYCDNFTVLETEIRPRDNISRHLSLTFQLDSKRVQTLVWNAPGVFVEVTRLNESGARMTTKRPLGSTEVVSLTSSKQIVVSSSESGELSLGDWTQVADFSRQASKQLAASFLASRITAQSQVLTFRPFGSTVGLPLLKLVQPHSVDSISDKVVDGQLLVKLKSTAEIEAILVKTKELLSGQDIEIELQANNQEWTNWRMGRARLMTLLDSDGGFVSSLYIAFDQQDTSAWTFRFDGKISGIWGHLQNQRLDQFAVGFLCDESGAQASFSKLSSSLSELTERQSLVVFGRLNEELLPCYSLESWTSMRWLSKAWAELVERWTNREGEGITNLVDMACSRPPEDAAPSWMPQLYIGADLPGIYAAGADVYRQVNELCHPLAKSLRAIAQVSRVYPAIFGDLLHVCVAMGFSNFPAITRGAAPKSFSLEAYAQALRQVESSSFDFVRLEDSTFMPDAGDFLGPIHLRWAKSRLLVAYENTLEGNEIRRGQAIGLCLYLRKVMPTLNGGALPRLKGTRPYIEPWPLPQDEFMASDVAQQNENLANIQHFLSLFALHCRASALTPNSLKSFLATLHASELPVEACISYLLQVGESFFAYYLLLWEVALKGEQTP